MSAFSNKTVLITGATGLMGSHIASFLLKENNVKNTIVIVKLTVNWNGYTKNISKLGVSK